MKTVCCVMVMLYAAVAASWGAADKGAADTSTRVAEGAVLPVKAVQAEPRAPIYYLDVPGVVRAHRETVLSFRIPGLITDFPIDVGQTVAQGDMVAQLDLTHFQNEHELAKLAAERAGELQTDSQDDYDRMRELLAKQAVSRQDYQNAHTAAMTASAEQQIAEKRVAEAQRELGHATLRAPYSGIIASKSAQVFQTVSAGQPIVLLMDPTSMLFRVQLPTSLRYETTNFTSYQCVFKALGGQTIPATLNGIGPNALPPLRTFPLTVRLDLSDGVNIMPGTGGNLRIGVDQSSQSTRILVPSTAVVSDHEGHPRIWVVDRKSETVQPRNIQIAGLHEGQIAIEDGIQPGEWVVTAGQSRLTAGQRVRIVTPITGTDLQ